MLVIRIANYPDRLGLLGKFVENSTKLTCLGITGNRIKYSAVLRLLELQIRRGRNV
jgi:ribosomal protein S18